MPSTHVHTADPIGIQQAMFGSDPTIARSLAERPLKEWPASERPVERLYTVGPSALADAEVLALLLNAGRGAHNALAVAQALLTDHGGWHGMQRMTVEQLAQTPGMTRDRAAVLKAALEVARRLVLTQPDERMQIRSPSDAAQLLMLEMGHLDQEQLRVVNLDTKNKVQKISLVYVGSLNTSMVRISEIFKDAIRLNAAAILVAHNHPSSDTSPSPEDVLVTRQIVEAGQLLDIPLLDHLVIGAGRFVSMREKGLGFAKS